MRKHSNTIKEHDIFLWVNITLFGVTLLLIFYYIMIANSIAAKNYKIHTLQDRLEDLMEKNSSLMAEKIGLESPAVLIQFAKDRNLVKAGNVLYIFESKNVAKR